MVATLTTKPIKDGSGSLFLQRALDVSGTGAGPFLPLQTLAGPDGAGPIDLTALFDAVVTAIGAELGASLRLGGNAVSAANPLPVGGAQIATATATIASGASLSGAVDLGTGRLVGIIVPPAWTSAAITFQASADSTNFYDLYDDATERAIASGSVVASRLIALPLSDWLTVRALKIRSGSSASPVNQAAARSLVLVVA